jgi:hypothetical protein
MVKFGLKVSVAVIVTLDLLGGNRKRSGRRGGEDDGSLSVEDLISSL